MDWENLNADKNLILNKHYTSGRSGRSVEHVVIHYNAGDLTVEGCYSVWQSREASAHYQVQSDGTIGQLVWDRDTAWHASNWNENCRSIGIEHANKSGGYVTEACLDAGAHLTAAICKYYGLGRPEWRKNVFPHWDFASTSCPGRLGDEQNAAYMARAQAWYDAMTGSASAPSADTGSTSGGSTPTVEGTVTELAQRVINGEFGNGDARKAALGDRYDEVQAEVNRILGGGTTTATKSVAELAQEVINGNWGNGSERKERLTAAGYDYDAVQAKVNELMGSSSSSSVDIDALARAVINGDYGNGEERKKRLGSNYAAVQARVNELLS